MTRSNRISSRGDLSIVVDREGSTWVGFTASTGEGYENHDILNWSFDSAKVFSNASVVSSDITYLLWSCLPIAACARLSEPSWSPTPPATTSFYLPIWNGA